MTWLMQGRTPSTVTAVTQQIKPDIYPKVDDEATIILTYPKAQAILQASWNWPFNRKDMEVYGQSGYVWGSLTRTICACGAIPQRKRSDPLVRRSRQGIKSLSYLAAVVRSDTRPSGLSSLELNMIVTEILDAARESARTGKRVDLP